MADRSVSYPLRQIPLHLIAEILAKSEYMQQLGVAVLSHRIFYDAFNQRRHFIIRNIITNQIPPDELSFAIILQESTRIDVSDSDAVRTFLTERSEVIRRDTLSPFAKLSASEATIISHNHTAVESLIHGFADEVILICSERLQVHHSRELTQRERFRLSRAFYRYQLMCNLFCVRDDSAFSDEDCTKYFFSIYSPWVNEQLVCVYAYLERSICNGASSKFPCSV